MKRIVLLLAIITSVATMSAQKWEKMYHPADELLDKPAYTQYQYSDSRVTVTISNAVESDLFDLFIEMTDRKYARYAKCTNKEHVYAESNETTGLTGFYNTSGKLVKKTKGPFWFYLGKGAYCVQHVDDDDVLDYLLHNTGYVRFVFEDGAIDFKIPCFN